jgi:hypothetical protein
VIHGKGEAWNDRDHDTALPRHPVMVRPDNPFDKRVPYLIFNLDVVNYGTASSYQATT